MADTTRKTGTVLDLYVIGGVGLISAQDGRDNIVSAKQTAAQDNVKDKDLSVPPGAPAVGDRYIVAAGGSGLWSGQDDDIAEWMGTLWFFWTPVDGWMTFVEDEALVYEFLTTWQVPSSSISVTSASATGTTTTTSAVDVAVASMTVAAPAAGDFFAIFSGSVDSGTVNASIFTSIHNAGVQEAESEREWGRGGGAITQSFHCITEVMTLAASDSITGEWRTTAGTASMYERVLMLIRTQ